ncbi:hypothetical protein B0A52_03359 [Exophiala mesophila]|uniref:Retrovirus-related Pol polyprotein from transposon TNT 1-94-like beta-barrel domain-containing protein n=1 Tax=Exophiala mesophila TaxID=212818 RepID=A0A438NBL8_EXOME|nr:hypothetical protein B0A52_03359 [Exophiala mesophila]
MVIGPTPLDTRPMDHDPKPRGNLPLGSYYSHPALSLSDFSHHRSISTNKQRPVKNPEKSLCHDWVFSTASNAHVAIDRAAFQTYTPFKSYVLTFAEQRQVAVEGIGSVEIKIRKASRSREGHKITLENVLHVPEWLCNIMSDIVFTPDKDYDHTWTRLGVNFFKFEGGKARSWGFTEDFCGLDRLVLSRPVHGRSPMLDDPGREVFSVSLTWPQSQIDKWEESVSISSNRNAVELEGATTQTEQIAVQDDESQHQSGHGQDSLDAGSDLLKAHKKQVKSVENSRWKVMADLNALSAHMKKHSKSGLFELEGNCDFLKRVSSLNFSQYQSME